MPRVKILHGNKIYNSKKEFERYARELIYKKIGICDSVKGTDYYEELIELLKRHHEFEDKSKNMNDLIIQKNSVGNGLEIHFVDEYNNFTDISWRTAIKGKARSIQQNFTNALRETIFNQIMEFKKNNVNVCELCNSSKEVEYHVDHKIHFQKLVVEFLDKNKLPVPKTFGNTNDGRNRTVFLKQDEEFKASWENYHKDNAVLRILCKDCNLSRKNYSN